MPRLRTLFILAAFTSLTLACGSTDAELNDTTAPNTNNGGSAVGQTTPPPPSSGGMTATPIDPSEREATPCTVVNDPPPSFPASLRVDTTCANIPTIAVLSGGPPPQGIPALGFRDELVGQLAETQTPSFVSIADAGEWLGDQEPVIVVDIDGNDKAYPLQILMWHEIANDDIGGVPVAVTFCPLCNSALAFDRRIPLTEVTRERALTQNPNAQLVDADAAYVEALGRDDVTSGLQVTFGTSGRLYNSNLLMFDSSTHTLWSQLLGEGHVGTMTGVELLRYPAQIVSFASFRQRHPEGQVLSRDTGFTRSYGTNPYVGYDDVDNPPFLFQGDEDERLPPKARVVSVVLNGESVAYPFSVLEEVGVINDTAGGEPIAVFWQPGTNSSIDRGAIVDGRDVGAVGVFKRTVNGEVLTFATSSDGFTDEAGSATWDILGEVTSTDDPSRKLESVVHDNTLWFAWAAFRPETRVYTSP